MSNLFTPKSPLTFYERQIIEMRLRGNWKIRRIARYLKRNHTIVMREVRRNKHPSGKYLAVFAEERARMRSHRTNKRKIDKDFLLELFVRNKLKEGWSPQQIAGRLKEIPPPNLHGQAISHESIYQYIYNSPYGHYLYHYLRYKKSPKRQKHYTRKAQKPLILERIFINERPAVINQRLRFGDWESDTAQFRKQRPGVSVQCERKSLLVRLHKIENRSAEETKEALIATAESLPENTLLQSITFDNGGENSCHTVMRDIYGADTFFCEPYKSWQKGGVENSIGLIRQYLPRSADLATIDKKALDEIQERLNNRPRKKLGYLTPNEVIRNHLSRPRVVL